MEGKGETRLRNEQASENKLQRVKGSRAPPAQKRKKNKKNKTKQKYLYYYFLYLVNISNKSYFKTPIRQP